MNSSDYHISIIIPVYNVEEYIADCVRSVMQQTFQGRAECILVDDCGSDKSIETAEEIISEYKGPLDFRIIHRDINGGLSAARNTGIKAARGEYVYFLDSDDIISPYCLDLLWQRVVEHPDVQIVTGDLSTFPEQGLFSSISIMNKKFPDYSNSLEWVRSVYLSTFPLIACNKLIKTSFIRDNSLYFRKGIIHEDNHWMALSYPFVSSLAFVNVETYFYRIRPNSITNNPQKTTQRLSNLYLIFKEMFARDMKWDYNWAKWVFNGLDRVRYPHLFGFDEVKAKKAYKDLMGILISNKSVPFPIKLTFYYYRFPRMFMTFRLIEMVLKFY